MSRLEGGNMGKSRFLSENTRVGPVCLFILSGFLLFTTAIFADAGDDLFKKAKKKTVSQEWNEAIALYEEFIQEYAGHKNEDDAFFWLAYCLKKKNPDDIQAFLAFDELINTFPNSAWVDDAIVHQVGMAAHFVESGKDEFVEFLYENLDSENDQIRQQTAIALGKLGDPKALPVLKRLAEEPDYFDLVDPLIRRIEKKSPDESPVIAAKTRSRKAFEITTQAPQGEMKTESTQKKWEWKGVLPTLYTRRHRQYLSMLKTNEKWSEDELIDFGMWTILPSAEFEPYHQLSGYDRSEWLRKFWKKLDPTPTTEFNEAWEEFRNRVKYAYTHFSETWDYRHFQYKRDMYQRNGWPNAPWDARGELYVKYGPPQFQTIYGWHAEQWSYYKYHVDFIIKLYETNIYYSAIEPGSLSYYTYGDNIEYVISNFINNSEYRYHHEYKADPLKLHENRFYTDEGILKFDYSIPLKELRYDRQGDVYQFSYNLTVVALDEDMREVYRQEEVKSFSRENKKAYKQDKFFSDQIQMRLIPGPYMIAIKIEDTHSKKLGIFLKDIDTSRPPK
jgi:GWxTD domain-containing protein